MQPNEIVPMLEDYAREQNVSMDFPAVAEALFYYTSGYPFLVSALCKQLGDYMERQQLPEGFLVIFEQTATKSWKKGWIKAGGKQVFAVWV